MTALSGFLSTNATGKLFRDPLDGINVEVGKVLVINLLQDLEVIAMDDEGASDDFAQRQCSRGFGLSRVEVDVE